MIARLDDSSLVHRERLVQALIPPDPDFWYRRISLEEDLLTWWATMVQLQEAIASREPKGPSVAFAARHFQRIGRALAIAGATSGAELADGLGTIVPRVRHGSFRYER